MQLTNLLQKEGLRFNEDKTQIVNKDGKTVVEAKLNKATGDSLQGAQENQSQSTSPNGVGNEFKDARRTVETGSSGISGGIQTTMIHVMRMVTAVGLGMVTMEF